MRRRIKAAISREVTLPRWALVLDFFYRIFLVVAACVVIVLWFQAATRDEEADRNARIQSCSSSYAATYSSWDAEAGSLFGQLISASVEDEEPDLHTVRSYTTAVDNAAEMARRRIGLASYAAASVEQGNSFECPTLPARLQVNGVDP